MIKKESMILSFPLRTHMDMKSVINAAKRAGYSGVEISVYPDPKSKDAFLKLKKEIKEFELVTAHYPCHSEESKMLYSFSMLKRRIGARLLADEFEFLAKFEPELYVVHAARAYSPTEDFAFLRDKCEEYGMRLSIENSKKSPRNDLDYVRRICKLLEVGMTLDLGHAFHAKQDIENLSRIKDVVEHVHLYNITDRTHQGLSSGLLSIPKLVQALKEIGYDKGIVIEMHKDPNIIEELAESKKILEVLWKKL